MQRFINELKLNNITLSIILLRDCYNTDVFFLLTTLICHYSLFLPDLFSF